MNQPEPSGSGEPNTKKRKENNENDQNADGDISSAAIEEQTAEILKLDIDCCEEAFDYLPVKDLVSIGKTCKRMQQMAGHCFRLYYSGIIVNISKEGIFIYTDSSHVNVDHFAAFIKNILINDEYGLRYFFEKQSKFRQLKQISIKGLKLTDMDRLKKNSMGQLEDLRIWNCELTNSFGEFIDQCAKLRHLEIVLCTGELNWLNQKHPTLEYFRFFPKIPIDDFRLFLEDLRDKIIPTFLELNPNIRKFSTTGDFLQKHRDTMMAANMKLDNLAILSISSFRSEICDLLNELHTCGFYEKLQSDSEYVLRQTDIDRLALRNELNTLFLGYCLGSVTLSSLNNLEKLYVTLNFSRRIVDIDDLPNALINLKNITFGSASIDTIMPFIRRSVGIQKIKVDCLEAGAYFNEDTGIIDLRALNRERAQLPNAQKITLYVSRWIYLATKWAFGGVDFALIQLKRSESILLQML